MSPHESWQLPVDPLQASVASSQATTGPIKASTRSRAQCCMAAGGLPAHRTPTGDHVGFDVFRSPHWPHLCPQRVQLLLQPPLLLLLQPAPLGALSSPLSASWPRRKPTLAWSCTARCAACIAMTSRHDDLLMASKAENMGCRVPKSSLIVFRRFWRQQIAWSGLACFPPHFGFPSCCCLCCGLASIMHRPARPAQLPPLLLLQRPAPLHRPSSPCTAKGECADAPSHAAPAPVGTAWLRLPPAAQIHMRRCAVCIKLSRRMQSDCLWD